MGNIRDFAVGIQEVDLEDLGEEMKKIREERMEQHDKELDQRDADVREFVQSLTEDQINYFSSFLRSMTEVKPEDAAFMSGQLHGLLLFESWKRRDFIDAAKVVDESGETETSEPI